MPVVEKWLPALFALSLSAIGPAFEVMAQADQLVRDFPVVTNIAQLRWATGGNMGSICNFSIEGNVLEANSDSGIVFLQDDSGAEVLETGMVKPALRPGQRIRLRGTNYVTFTGVGTSLGQRPVIDNDGWHPEVECTATVYLKAGWYPLQVLWFNHLDVSSLGVDYSGPNFGRRAIPDSALFRTEKAPDGKIRFASGLNYRCYEGDWEKLPSFEVLTPVKTGFVSNFEISARTREELVGLVFDGFLNVDKDGPYTFYLKSNDGSKLFINNTPTQLTVIGTGEVPAPKRIVIRQPLSGEPGAFWAEVEGRVTFFGRQPYGDELELTSDNAQMRLLVYDSSEESPSYLLGSRVRVRGICLNPPNIENHRLADTMVVSGWSSIQVQEVAPEAWLIGRNSTIRNCRLAEGREAPGIVRFRGKLRSRSSRQLPELEDGTGAVPIELLNPPPAQLGGKIECLGRWTRTGHSVLRAAVWRELPEISDNKTDVHPLLTTAAQVQQLTRDEARRNYPAKIRGVVTWVSDNRDCVVLQDATRGVFVGLRSAWIWETPKIGEILEIEGTCVAGEFSPIIILNKGERLGMGSLPPPMHPTWDQLISGSMDSQYVEIRGYVTRARDNHHMTLLMPGGRVELEFYPAPASSLESFVNSVVRIRGVMFAKWDHPTLLVTPDHPLWFNGASISVETPPPQDLFNADTKRVKELMQFDVQGNIFRRVKVFGQLLHGGLEMNYLTDDGFGLRFQPVHPVHFDPGDNVEVAGLVELGGASPVLREAVARKTGHSPLPVPQQLLLDNTNITYDAALVWVEGLLVGAKDTGLERVLEIQIGLKSFIARLPETNHSAMQWPVGSRLKLTGVFHDLGGNLQGRHVVNSFELLLNSPSDIELLARPPWWTLNRLLAMVAVLAAGLALAFIWISQLRRQVERRTVQLKLEINERQRAEQDRAIEQERSRIARDLHDDLGSSLTAISMLAMAGRGKKLPPEAGNERLQLVADKARLMVTTLDALVWTVNPKNDTVAALAEYLASYAEELLGRTEIVCRVELPLDFPAQTIAAETRHNVLLSVREALTNAVRHGRPSEVFLKVTHAGSELEILIRDNGCGFDPARNIPGNGLANLQERVRKVNGRCRIESSPGNGTVVFLTLPI